VTIPGHVLDSSRPTIDELRSVQELSRANDLFSRIPAIHAALSYASSFVDRSDGRAWPKGVRVNPPGLPTVTVDSRSGRLVGLHVDKLGSTRRSLSATRRQIALDELGLRGPLPRLP